MAERRPEPEVLTHDGSGQATISFAMLLNLAAVSNDENPSVLWGFLRRYYPSASPETHPRLDSLVRYAVAYFRDFVAPKKRYREADDVERGVLMQISSKLSQLPADVERGRNPACALRYRPADSAISGPFGQGGDGRAAGGLKRIFQYDLCRASRRESRAALRIVHCDLWVG